MKFLMTMSFFIAIAGCQCIELTPQERTQIFQLEQQGIAWWREHENGNFSPAVSLLTVDGWSAIPGAGQLFLAHKIKEVGLEDRFGKECEQLKIKGFTMIAFSWIPGIHCIMWIYGTIGGHLDAFYINDYYFLDQIKNGRCQFPAREAQNSRQNGNPRRHCEERCQQSAKEKPMPANKSDAAISNGSGVD